MKALCAVNEEPVITIAVNGETLNECRSVEESYVDDVNGGILDPEMVREGQGGTCGRVGWMPQYAGVLPCPSC